MNTFGSCHYNYNQGVMQWLHWSGPLEIRYAWSGPRSKTSL